MDDVHIKQEEQPLKHEEDVVNAWAPNPVPVDLSAMQIEEEPDRNEPQRRQTNEQKRKKWLTKFRALSDSYETFVISEETYFKKGRKFLKNIGFHRRTAEHLPEDEGRRFVASVNKRQDSFLEEVRQWVGESHMREIEKCIIPMDKKKPESWQYNFVLNEAIIQDDQGRVTLRIPMNVYEALYPYQRKGVQWMNELMCDRIGGILADDMGLGKTVQACVLMEGMYRAKKVKKILLVVPVPTFGSWKSHIKTWAPSIYMRPFRGSRQKNMKAFERTCDAGGILMTSYETMRGSVDILDKARFDLAIFDEGHKIKNRHSKQSIAARKIKIKFCRKIMLTGTPMQNKMSELWSLIDWCTEGKVLGTYAHFNTTYAKTIDAANSKDAGPVQTEIAEHMRIQLKNAIDPIQLRRTKADVGIGCKVQKNEVVVWISLTDMQMSVYNDFLKNPDVRYGLDKKQNPLSSLLVLKKICDHPFILNPKNVAAVPQLKALGDLISNPSYSNVINASGKLAVLEELLKVLKREGHRVLIFSRLKKTMKMIHQILNHLDYKFLYINGEVVNEEREDLISQFNNGEGFAFCATTGVGGLGISLTGADRVIIYDPDWNPSNDAQAVDRSYRRGQTKNVIAYRFVTCGTIEEKIYRRQISKKALLEMVLRKDRVKRFFTREELLSVFAELTDVKQSETQKLIVNTHPDPLKPYSALLHHYEAIEDIGLVAGISHHHDELFRLTEEQVKEEVDAERQAERANHVAVRLNRLNLQKQNDMDFIQDTLHDEPLSDRERRRQCAEGRGWNAENFMEFTGEPPNNKKKKEEDDLDKSEKDERQKDWEQFTQKLDYDKEAQIEADPSPKPLCRSADSTAGSANRAVKLIDLTGDADDEPEVKQGALAEQENQNEEVDLLLDFLDNDDREDLNRKPLEMPPLEPALEDEPFGFPAGSHEDASSEDELEDKRVPTGAVKRESPEASIPNSKSNEDNQLGDKLVPTGEVKRESSEEAATSRHRLSYSFLEDDSDGEDEPYKPSDQDVSEVLSYGISDDMDLIKKALSKRITVRGALNYIMDKQSDDTSGGTKRKRDETSRPVIKRESDEIEMRISHSVKDEEFDNPKVDPGTSDAVMEILQMQLTTDPELIYKALRQCNFDKEQAVHYIIHECSNEHTSKRRKLNSDSEMTEDDGVAGKEAMGNDEAITEAREAEGCAIS